MGTHHIQSGYQMIRWCTVLLLSEHLKKEPPFLKISRAMSPVDIDSISSELLTTLYGFYNLEAVVTILAIDILETFHDEVTYIWKKKLSINTLLYVITRYLPFIINAVFIILALSISAGTVVSSTTLYLLYCIPWFVVWGCTEYLFIKRVLALNGNPRWLFYLLIVLLIAEISTSFVSFLVISLLPLSSVSAQPILIHIRNSLLPVVFPRLPSIIAFGAPGVVFQSILVTVIVITILQHRKTWRLRSQSGSLVNIIIRDGLWGYFFNLFGLLVVIVQPNWLAGPAGQPSLQWSYVTLSVTSSRLLLNIRSGAGTSGMTSDTLPSSLYFNSIVSQIIGEETR